MRRVHLIIRGKVQGVFFRESARREAVRLGLLGWIRNLPTGEVEALVEGEGPAVEGFTGWCRSGPPLAQVAEVIESPAQTTAPLPPFRIER